MSEKRVPINDTCPWSGKSVAADSTTEYKGHLVGFCNQQCRDKFNHAIKHFEDIIKAKQ